MRITGRVTVTAAAGGLKVDTVRRRISGTLFRYGEVGLTSQGPLSVEAPGALTFEDAAPLTREHDRPYVVRGSLLLVDDSPERCYVAMQVDEGPEGDAALEEADKRKRAGLSFDVEDADVRDGVIISGRVVAIGQVEDPAFNSARIDQIAASNNTPGEVMTPEQRARLAALLEQETRTAEEETELAQLQVLAEANPEPAATEPAPAAAPAAASPAAGVPVAASVPAVPSGIPRPPTQTSSRGASALQTLFRDVAAGLNRKSPTAITAALSDIVSTGITEDIEPFAWSGELWSGLQYVPEWSDLLAHGSLTNWEGKGWRFTKKLAIADYAGDKAAIPSDTVTTEQSSYTAARMAVGVDVDRKFFDFDNATPGFVQQLFEQVRESWEIQLDAKVRAWILANAVAGTRPLSVTTANGDATVEAANGSFTSADVGATITGTGIPGATTILSVTDSGTIEMSANATATGTVTATIGAQSPTVLKAAARASMILKRRRVGKAGWIVVNDEDMFSLLDVAEKDVPAFLELWGIAPGDFRSSPDVPAGTVVAGVRQVGVLRTMPGSPIRVEAQNIVNGGVDEGFFGYWAIEEHHTSGIVTVKYKAAA